MIRFSPFEIDPRTWLLTRDGQAVDLSPRLVEILAFLAGRPGDIVTKDELLARFWPDVHISDNTLTRAIADIRHALGDSAAEPRYIQTLARRGYRFVPPPAPLVDPFQDWVKGRLALESLDPAQLPAATAAFERAAAELPSYAPAHAALANAYLLGFEQTRFTNVPDRALLERAIRSARQACAVDPALGEGWAVLGYLLAATGRIEEGRGAARRATALEPGSWRHHFRLACVTWGEERLRAVDRVLALMPACAPARLLSATVFVARGVLARAEEEATRGAEVQRQRSADASPMRAAGLHWVRGLILAARGAPDAARECFDEEIASAGGHLYGREFGANARVAAGFLWLADDDVEAAAHEFEAVLAETPTHARAVLGVTAASIQNGRAGADEAEFAPLREALDTLRANGRHAEAALVDAGASMIRGRAADAMSALIRELDHSLSGSSAWIIPVDPMLAGLRSADGHDRLLVKLASRAA